MKKILSSFITVALLLPLSLVLSTSALCQEYQFVLKWGSYGLGDGQFWGPDGIAVDSHGDVYVVDWYTNQVQKFDSEGNFIRKWGGYGWNEPGKFYLPYGIAADPNDNVYVGSKTNIKIQKFDSDGNFIPSCSWNPSEEIYDVAIDSDGNVYVLARGYDKIIKYTSTGGYLTDWAGHGYGQGQFRRPWGIAVDHDGNVYVTDHDNNRIQKFDSDGNYLTEWGSFGWDDGYFNKPAGIDVDSGGNVYVVDSDNHLIQKFDSNGNYLTEWGSYGLGDGQLKYPEDIVVDSDGNVFVNDYGNSRIQKFSLLDTNQPPVAVCQDIVIDADESCQANITAEDIGGDSTDPDNDELTLSIDPEGPFPLGVTSVTLTVSDGEESDSCTATVTVVDKTAPVPDVSLLPDVTGECSAEINTVPTATDCAGSILGTTEDPISYTEQGTYIVTWTYDDGSGNTTTQTQTVDVKDTTPPNIQNLNATPNVLRPSNHKMVAVSISANVYDNCDLEPEYRIIAVSSNEPVNGLGDGDKAPDWEITGNLTVNLRAERSGKGSGRVYTITVECTDASGYKSEITTTVTVPHDKKKK